MGRSPLVTRQYRAHIRGQNVSGTLPDTDGTEKPHFPRRFPRLGREFQTKVAKQVAVDAGDADLSSRPTPQLMSTSYPHITKDEAQCSQKEPSTSNTAAVGVCRQGYECMTERGGLLLHRPSEDSNRFQTFTKPLFQSDGVPPPTQVTDDAWKQRLIHLHSNMSPKAVRGRNPRGGGPKRKRDDEEEEMVWGLESMTRDAAKQQRKNKTRARRQLGSGEDDACALEYLHRHGGNATAAELSVLVNLSAGRATKRRKCLQKKIDKDRVKLPPTSSSESWRKVYERTFPSLFGKVEGDSTHSYPVHSLGKGDDTLLNSLDLNLAADNDDAKGTWRSVLACAKSWERQLNGDAGGSKKPLLSTLVSFVRNVHGLPSPESCFGTNHVVVEEVSNCMLTLLNHVDQARQVQAKLNDALYDEPGEGVDVDALQKYLDSTSKSLSVRLDEADTLYRYRQVVSEWEAKVEKILESSRGIDDKTPDTQNDLVSVQKLSLDAQAHGFRSKSLVQLDARIAKAHKLKDRIAEWTESCSQGRKGSIKQVAALVRDTNRLKLAFPESTEILRFHRATESWVDRASIAVRSKISLTEIKSLIQRGEDMPLDLSDYLEKLKSRVAVAEGWLDRLKDVVQSPLAPGGHVNELAWLADMRIALLDGRYGRLHELASEGSRIPVDVEPLKLLQVELDAKNWSAKASKWVPCGNGTEGKKGKLDDIREHVYKAELLRDKLTLSEVDKKLWSLEGELALKSIVQAADSWLEQNKVFLEGDNRRSQLRRPCISIVNLRKIAEEGCSIHANIGNATTKISRILAQAEAWYQKHQSLLVRCNLDPSTPASPVSLVDLSEMVKAVESASATVSLDLDEAINLKNLRKRIDSWFERALVMAPKRSKRNGRATKAKATVEDLVNLIEEASSLPVDTAEELKRLQMQLSCVQTWRLEAAHQLERISSGFEQYRESINLAFGEPKEFSRDRSAKSEEESTASVDELASPVGSNSVDIEVSGDSEPKEVSEDQMSQTETASTAESEQDIAVLSSFSKGDSNVHRMIKDLQKGAKESGVVTVEAELSEKLDVVSRWCALSLKYLDSPRDIFDKRFFGAFDRFVDEGKEHLEQSKNTDIKLEQAGLADALRASWGGVISDQLQRLNILLVERDQFTVWCDSASQILADEKKLTVEKLKELATQSRDFPALSDMVQRIRGLSVKVDAWSDSTRKAIESGKKLSLPDAKAMFDAGEKLNVNCPELKILRTALRAARGWANRVKRCNLEQGSIHVNTVKDLIKEHGSFLIEMPDELSMLNNATKNYCICRRPYDGFMIGCDECDEWYHGSCIGVSESRADRFDKYVCTRCSISNVFKNSSNSAVMTIRKWTCKKDLKKARQVESQKHQRKVRKETKDIEKFRGTIVKLEAKLASNQSRAVNDETPGLATESTVANDGSQPSTATSVEGTPMAMDKEGTVDDKEAKDSIDLKDIETQIMQQKKSIQLSEERLAVLAVKLQERKDLERKEDNNSDKLRRWCLTVRSLVMVPSSPEQALNARPLGNGSLSGAMCMVIGDAEKLGIADAPDVDVVINAFKCMSWSLFTLAILRRKPKFSEISEIVSLASALKLPEEKGLRTMKTMLQRATQWQVKVTKALAPKQGLTKPFKPISMEVLKDLESGVEECPLRIPESGRLRMAIEDKGARYCICGGPTDGSFMVGCDKCDSWFHGACVGVHRDDSDELKNWLCPGCSGKKGFQQELSTGIPNPSALHDSTYGYDSEDEDEEEEIPHAPAPARMWPPFGLFGSDTATAALGECAKIPDDFATDSSKSIMHTKPRSSGGAEPPKYQSSESAPAAQSAAPPLRVASNTVSSDTKPMEPPQQKEAATLPPTAIRSDSQAPVVSDTCKNPETPIVNNATEASPIVNNATEASVSAAAVTEVANPAPADSNAKCETGLDSPTPKATETKPVKMEIEPEHSIPPTKEDNMADRPETHESDKTTSPSTETIVSENVVKDMEVDEPQDEVISEPKPENEEVVSMEVEDSSLETRSEILSKSHTLESRNGEQPVELPPTQQCVEVPNQAGLNGLRSSTSFAEVSLDQSSATTTEGRGTIQTKDEENSSWTKSDATESRVVVEGPSKTIPSKESSSIVDTAAKVDDTLRPCVQTVSLPLGMKVEVKSAEASSAVTSDATSPTRDDADANLSCGEDPPRDNATPAVPVAPPLLANVLVTMKDGSA